MNVNWERFALVEKLELFNNDLNFTSRNIWIFETFATFANRTGSFDDIFVTQRFCKFECISGIRIDNELDNSGVVAEVNKN